MLTALTAAARQTVRSAVRDATRKIVLLAVGLVLLGTAVVFAQIALYLWLRTQTTGYLAALAASGVSLALVVIVALVASTIGARPGRGTPAALADTDGTGESPGTDPTVRLAAEAEALGAMLGRQAKGYQLVLGAFLVGLLLGRGRR